MSKTVLRQLQMALKNSNDTETRLAIADVMIDVYKRTKDSQDLSGQEQEEQSE